MSKKETLKLALERISILHRLSLEQKESRPEFSRRYIQIMENIAKRTDITLPARIKRSYCKACKMPYGPGTRIRSKSGKILLLTCGFCGDKRRFDYSTSRKESQSGKVP